jgi:uncharacterized protein YecT (DUF1311 family)
MLGSEVVRASSSSLEECLSKEVLSGGGYECSKFRLKNSDYKMNRIYSGLITAIGLEYRPDPELGKKLVTHIKNSQRAWLVVRDENCLVEAFVIDPAKQAYEEIRNNCLARETESRSDYLEGLRF